MGCQLGHGADINNSLTDPPCNNYRSRHSRLRPAHSSTCNLSALSLVHSLTRYAFRSTHRPSCPCGSCGHSRCVFHADRARPEHCSHQRCKLIHGVARDTQFSDIRAGHLRRLRMSARHRRVYHLGGRHHHDTHLRLLCCIHGPVRGCGVVFYGVVSPYVMDWSLHTIYI